jgi:2-polyprenyl-6-methoxyphenol hydroxylase-like FAD-dependent oxidoreductase
MSLVRCVNYFTLWFACADIDSRCPINKCLDEALMTSTLIGKRAVVVGAGMAGLPAARALADYFERVVVLERDALPPNAAHRTGTPQAWHTHGLLRGGQQALAILFPGFEQDLAGHGAVPLRAGLDIRLERPGFDPFPQRDLAIDAYAMSRPLVEFAVRRRVEQHPNITIREHCRARDLVASQDGAAVSAIRFENGHGRAETLTADLIVEASGRGNLTFAFLEPIGLPRPRPWKNAFAEYGGPTSAVRLRQVCELIQALRPGSFAAAVRHQ